MIKNDEIPVVQRISEAEDRYPGFRGEKRDFFILVSSFVVFVSLE